MTLVEVADLRVSFGAEEAVRGISFTVGAGECVAVVGESGSGKSVTARTLLGLSGGTVTASTLALDGQSVLGFTGRDWRKLRGRFAGLVLQDALVSLDPLRTVGAEVGWAGREKVIPLLESVGIPEPSVRARQHAHQLSGGLRQRALIASAIAADPRLIIADEPTTALDVTVQAQVLSLLAARKALGTALLIISHDLAVVASIADRILVMKDGQIVEEGPTEEVLGTPTHPYTRTLLAAIPSAASRGTRLSAVASGGTPLRAPLPTRTISWDTPALTATNLSFSYGSRQVVDDVSFTLHRGETLGIVGESGSGKTTVARLALALLQPQRGSVELHNSPWSVLHERQRRPRRSAIQLITQNPLDSFDPRHTVAKLIAQPAARTRELLERVGLDPSMASRHPRSLSGGQRQRVAIARALGPRPSVLICDEPVSALDVSIQAQVLDLLAELQAAKGLALLFISHDLGVVHHVSDRVLVMKDGRVVEEGNVDDLFFLPQHPYTQTLLTALPHLTNA
ncbi:dipeptide ABC transporter ATP-binding protein [Nonomuraea sp. NPDC050556]|uniref:dipeptide ABC transporter ATP-binding protein n=1 Tax=Nonomuraea sp. NPDC050556 TaxID=3364369 RepID=UPI003789CD0E